LLGFARPGDTVVVWRIDRLGRSLLGVLATVLELRDQDIIVQSIADRTDPATTTGRLMLDMPGTLAENKRELIVEPVKLGSMNPGRVDHLWPPGVAPEGDRREASARGGNPGSGEDCSTGCRPRRVEPGHLYRYQAQQPSNEM
jgi:DNA invertase Pin-like site-specific DNA recombinase